MSGYHRSSAGDAGGMGDLSRLLLGVLFILVTGFVGMIYAPSFGLEAFWPFAGIWGAVGWGGSRVSMKPVIALVVTGLLLDVSMEAPFGCWSAVQLSAYFTASVFRKRAQTDRSGLFRLVGDLVALLVAFIVARWIMGGYMGGVDGQTMVGNFLTTALLYLPFRSLFLLQRSRWVDA